MDVFKIDQTLSGNLGSAPSPDKITPEVSFDAGSEFNLSFFDQPTEDSSTQGFSDPGSVGSASASSPPPQQLQHLHLTPGGSSSSSVSSPGGPASALLLQPGASSSTSQIGIKQGNKYL